MSAFAVLDPRGAVALAERGLMVNAVLFMLIVAVPVYFLLFFFARRYRAGNKKAAYVPDWEHSKMEELIWWAIPLEIVLILGALTWGSTHALDPKKPLDDSMPMVVQVLAVPWEWRFTYPDTGRTLVNELYIPAGRPIRFELTAQGPMNSFWIPQLGGQIYAMDGMTTTLNLIADEEGDFAGRSANYSGVGFAGMKFTVHALSQAAFDAWALGNTP